MNRPVYKHRADFFVHSHHPKIRAQPKSIVHYIRRLAVNRYHHRMHRRRLAGNRHIALYPIYIADDRHLRYCCDTNWCQAMGQLPHATLAPSSNDLPLNENVCMSMSEMSVHECIYLDEITILCTPAGHRAPCAWSSHICAIFRQTYWLNV